MPSRNSPRSNLTVEYGDFQPPLGLARQVCSTLAEKGFSPVSIVEPTCGTGSFLEAALNTFPSVQRAIGVEINESHVEQSRRNLTPFKAANVKIIRADYFGVEWETLVRPLADPLLIIGNPPWVTSSALARMQSSNLPQKSNFQSLSGIQAITGSSNFDISESMILQALEWMSQRPAKVDPIIKTARGPN